MKKIIEILEGGAIEPNGFTILKPGFLNHYGEWRDLLVSNGWVILHEKIVHMGAEEAAELYLPHEDEDFYVDLVVYMSSGKSVVVSMHKDCKDPIGELDYLKDKVRAKWGKDDMKNAMHSSDSLRNVKRESGIFFK